MKIINNVKQMQNALDSTFEKVLKEFNIKKDSLHLINSDTFEKMANKFHKMLESNYRLDFPIHQNIMTKFGFEIWTTHYKNEKSYGIYDKKSIFWNYCYEFKNKNFEKVKMSPKELISYINRKRKTSKKLFVNDFILKEINLEDALNIIERSGNIHMGYGSCSSTIIRSFQFFKDKFGNIIIEKSAMIWD